MPSNKIIRSVCFFTDNPNNVIVERLNDVVRRLEQSNFVIQTKRICTPTKYFRELESKISDRTLMKSTGTLSVDDVYEQFDNFFKTNNVSFNIDLTNESISERHINILFEIIKRKPQQTFNFTYVFNNAVASPYFPSASYAGNGYAIGLQPTDLSQDCMTLERWFERMHQAWIEILELFQGDPDFLGIDSSVAPLFEGKSSLIDFIKRLGYPFSESVTTEMYMKITRFIKEENPMPVGLCGLMLPCLEDFELAKEYEAGNFTIERNVFLSLHSGLGIDTYPIGIDEDRNRIRDILKLVQGLSNKYQKPLSVRFVSDGKAKIGEKTNFKNQYLKDVVVKKL
jgi:uncharacterized protein (UPF0210 family)